MERLLIAVVAGIFFLLPVTAKAGSPDPVQDCVDEASEVATKLQCIEGLEVNQVASDSPGIQQYELKFTQPMDHTQPSLGTFQQRVVLLHRSETEPMVLQTSGYRIFGVAETGLMRVFDTNQIQIEHRYFAGSSPEIKDWSKLNIKQSADDFHRITMELKRIYKKAWVGTGASKGGMTSVYHRYFYPQDLDGTVSDVAPLSFSTSDERYIDFLNQAGGAKYRDCRNKFKQFQTNLLRHRDEILPQLSGVFTHLGGADVAFEHAVIESHFVFWQYLSPEDPSAGCAKVPVDAGTVAMFNYLQLVNNVESYTDQNLEDFAPYYYQAATQLGNPANVVDHFDGLRKYEFTIDQYTPKGVLYSYSNQSMEQVRDWVEGSAERIMFVYGEYDPWSAGAFPAGNPKNDMHIFTVKGGNHGSKFQALGDDDRKSAREILARWFNKNPVAMSEAFNKRARREDLESLELRYLRSRRL